MKIFDIIVVGAGHAGCEAALAASRMGCETLLLTINLDKIAYMPCSPSIGGVGKGQLVKEIDALGGEIGKIADHTGIQFRTLNTKKGIAVQSTRTQNDKNRYHILMKSVIENQKHLYLKQSLVDEIIVKNNKVIGVRDNILNEFKSKIVIITAGTFLNGLIHIGNTSILGGRVCEIASFNLSKNLQKFGFLMGRMKTGTPARIHKKSINFSNFLEINSEQIPCGFSLFSTKKFLPQKKCFIGHTNLITHKIIEKNLIYSPLYNGTIKGISARYCPSLEEKIVKFASRTQHQVILQYEGLDSQEIYVGGTGNSLPYSIQLDIIHSIKGLENAEIMRPAYAIEYDYIYPTQLNFNLESKIIKNLFFAGQLNGTSGYEEAAAQGFYAGVNAALKIKKKKSFFLDRSESYIGVMIDDLVTKGTDEPYRMMTSKVEYRLSLREDNAPFRLLKKGYKLGLINKDILEKFSLKKKIILQELNRLKKTFYAPDRCNPVLDQCLSPKINKNTSLSQILKRPEISYKNIQTIENNIQNFILSDSLIIKQIEIECKYEGYLKKQIKEIFQFRYLENIVLSPNINYGIINGLSNEVKQKLLKVRPHTLGQAARIPGITPSAISILLVFLKSKKK